MQSELSLIGSYIAHERMEEKNNQKIPSSAILIKVFVIIKL